MNDISLLKQKIEVCRKAGLPIHVKYETESQKGIGRLIDMYTDNETVFLIKTESGDEILLSSDKCEVRKTNEGTEICGSSFATKKKDNKDTRKTKMQVP